MSEELFDDNTDDMPQTELKKLVGQRIRDLRIRRHESREDLGNLVGVSESAIGSYERGDREIGVEELAKVAQHFGVSVNGLIGPGELMAETTPAYGAEDKTPNIYIPLELELAAYRAAARAHVPFQDFILRVVREGLTAVENERGDDKEG